MIAIEIQRTEIGFCVKLGESARGTPRVCEWHKYDQIFRNEVRRYLKKRSSEYVEKSAVNSLLRREQTVSQDSV